MGQIQSMGQRNKKGLTRFRITLYFLLLMARPEGVEPPTAWFVVFRLNQRIILYFYSFIRLTLSNKNDLFGLIWLYLGLFDPFIGQLRLSFSKSPVRLLHGITASFFCVSRRSFQP